MMEKNKQGNFRLTEDEFKAAKCAAKIERQSFSEWVRSLVRADLRTKELWPPIESVRDIPRQAAAIEKLPKKHKHSWTEEEDGIIRQYAATHEAKELVNLLPRHSLSSIYIRSYKLGVKLKRSTTPIIPLNGAIWTDEENTLLRQCISTETPIDEMMTILGKTKSAIQHRAKRMKLIVTPTKPPKVNRQKQSSMNRRWSDKENAILRKSSESGTPLDELVEKIGRTERAIQQQAYRLGISLRVKRQVPYWESRNQPTSKATAPVCGPMPAKQPKLPSRNLLVQLRQGGMTFQEIGELYGVSIDTVYLAFRRGKSEQARFEHGQTGA